MLLRAMCHYAWRDTQVWCVKSQNALYVRKHEGRVVGQGACGSRGCLRIRLRVNGLVGKDGEKCFGRNDAPHGVTDEDGAHRGVNRRRRRRVGDLEVYDFVLQPFFEATNALVQVASRLKLGVRDGEDRDFGQRMLEERLHVAREGSECFISTLEAVDETQQ